MGGLKQRAADHLLDVPHRRAGDRRRAGPGRVLQQGRDPLSHVRERPHAAVGGRAADVAADGDLHVPPRVPGVSRPQRLRPHAGPRMRSGTHDGHAAPHARRTDGARARCAGHRRHLHDAPPAMALALDRAGGRLDRRPATSGCRALGGASFEQFLEPSFGRRAAAREPRPRRRPRESTLMVVSIGRRARRHRHRGVLLPQEPRGGATRWPSGSPACTRCCSNKYYVDEIYDAAIVQPIRIVSEDGLWKVVDVARHRRRRQRRRRDRRRLRRACCGGCRPARCARTPRRCSSGSCWCSGITCGDDVHRGAQSAADDRFRS